MIKDVLIYCIFLSFSIDVVRCDGDSSIYAPIIIAAIVLAAGIAVASILIKFCFNNYCNQESRDKAVDKSYENSLEDVRESNRLIDFSDSCNLLTNEDAISVDSLIKSENTPDKDNFITDVVIELNDHDDETSFKKEQMAIMYPELNEEKVNLYPDVTRVNTIIDIDNEITDDNLKSTISNDDNGNELKEIKLDVVSSDELDGSSISPSSGSSPPPPYSSESSSPPHMIEFDGPPDENDEIKIDSEIEYDNEEKSYVMVPDIIPKVNEQIFEIENCDEESEKNEHYSDEDITDILSHELKNEPIENDESIIIDKIDYKPEDDKVNEIIVSEKQNNECFPDEIINATIDDQINLDNVGDEEIIESATSIEKCKESELNEDISDEVESVRSKNETDDIIEDNDLEKKEVNIDNSTEKDEQHVPSGIESNLSEINDDLDSTSMIVDEDESKEMDISNVNELEVSHEEIIVESNDIKTAEHVNLAENEKLNEEETVSEEKKEASENHFEEIIVEEDALKTAVDEDFAKNENLNEEENESVKGDISENAKEINFEENSKDIIEENEVKTEDDRDFTENEDHNKKENESEGIDASNEEELGGKDEDINVEENDVKTKDDKDYSDKEEQKDNESEEKNSSDDYKLEASSNDIINVEEDDVRTEDDKDVTENEVQKENESEDKDSSKENKENNEDKIVEENDVKTEDDKDVTENEVHNEKENETDEIETSTENEFEEDKEDITVEGCDMKTKNDQNIAEKVEQAPENNSDLSNNSNNNPHVIDSETNDDKLIVSSTIVDNSNTGEKTIISHDDKKESEKIEPINEQVCDEDEHTGYNSDDENNYNELNNMSTLPIRNKANE